jgi:anti-repressor protein
MSALIPFTFDGETVRVVEIDGEPHFVGKDVAERLGYADPTNAMKQHCRGVVKRHPIVDALGRAQEARVLSEPDVLRLIVGSKLPAAERFERWIFEDVLPTIRRTGSYAPRPTPAIDVRDPSQLATIAIQLIEVNKELETRAVKAEAAVAAAKPKTQFFDSFVNADGLYGLQNAARVLKEPPNKFIGWLKTEYLFYQGGALVPKVAYRQMGIFEVKATVVDDKARYQAFVTPKGIEYLARKLGKGTGDLFGTA